MDAGIVELLGKPSLQEAIAVVFPRDSGHPKVMNIQ